MGSIKDRVVPCPKVPGWYWCKGPDGRPRAIEVERVPGYDPPDDLRTRADAEDSGLHYLESEPVADYEWLDDLPIRPHGEPAPTFRSWYALVWQSPTLAPLSQGFLCIADAIAECDARRAKGYTARIERRTSEVIW